MEENYNNMVYGDQEFKSFIKRSSAMDYHCANGGKRKKRKTFLLHTYIICIM